MSALGEGVARGDQRGAGDRGGLEVGLDEQELEVGAAARALAMWRLGLSRRSSMSGL
jgi:hypothetical protein